MVEGKSADVIVLDANPLEDIKNTRQISGVYLVPEGEEIGNILRLKSEDIVFLRALKNSRLKPGGLDWQTVELHSIPSPPRPRVIQLDSKSRVFPAVGQSRIAG